MTWTKIDSALPDDPRVMQVPRGSRWLHLEGLVWCNQQGTDGHIPAYALRRVTDEEDPATAAGHLVTVGLWEVTEAGWRIVDFLRDQPSAEDVEATRASNRARQKRQNRHKTGEHSDCKPYYCKEASRDLSRVTHGVTNGVTGTVSNDPPTDRPTDRREEGMEEGLDSSDSQDVGSLRSAPASSSSEPVKVGSHHPPPWAAGLPPRVRPTVNGVEVTP